MIAWSVFEVVPVARLGFLYCCDLPSRVFDRWAFALIFLFLPSPRFIDCAFLGTESLLSFRVPSGYVGVPDGKSKQRWQVVKRTQTNEFSFCSGF